MIMPDLFLVGVAVLAGGFVVKTLLVRMQRVSKEDLMELFKQGAQIVDVRTSQEFAQGHAKGSRNIPLNELAARATELARIKPVVVCCASGARSATAKSLLERAGFPSVHNAGPWQNVSI